VQLHLRQHLTHLVDRLAADTDTLPDLVARITRAGNIAGTVGILLKCGCLPFLCGPSFMLAPRLPRLTRQLAVGSL
jgi:hypothetical protein